MVDVRDLGALALALAVAGIIISFTLLVQTEIQDEIETQTNNTSYAYNASSDAVEGVAEFSGWFVIIALALIFSIILGVIIHNIAGAGGRV